MTKCRCILTRRTFVCLPLPGRIKLSLIKITKPIKNTMNKNWINGCTYFGTLIRLALIFCKKLVNLEYLVETIDLL